MRSFVPLRLRSLGFFGNGRRRSKEGAERGQDWRVQFVPVKPNYFDPVSIPRLGLRTVSRRTPAFSQRPPSLPRRSFTFHLTRPPEIPPFPRRLRRRGKGILRRVFLGGW